MRDKWNKKLSSNTGSSMILVLMLFFLCVMVSSVVIAVATSGAGRLAKREAQQQGYLSVVSAVELATAEIESCGRFVGKETTIDYGCNIAGYMYYSPVYMEETRVEYHADDITASNSSGIWKVDEENTYLTGVFADLLMAACKSIYEGGELHYYNGFTLESGDGRLTNVHCNFTMDKDYNISMTFTGEDTNYTMTVKFPGVSMTTDEQKITTCNHIVKCKQEENGAFTNNFIERTRYYDGLEKIKRTMVSWGTPVITKGAY